MSGELQEILKCITQAWERKPEMAQGIGDVARGYPKGISHIGDLDTVKEGQEIIRDIK